MDTADMKKFLDNTVNNVVENVWSSKGKAGFKRKRTKSIRSGGGGGDVEIGNMRICGPTNNVTAKNLKKYPLAIETVSSSKKPVVEPKTEDPPVTTKTEELSVDDFVSDEEIFPVDSDDDLN